MAYKIFLSYAEQEYKLAEHIKAFISTAFEEKVQFYIAKVDILAGDQWKEHIKQGLMSSDAILILLTPKYIERPWAYIEWSAFWLANKKAYIVVTDEVGYNDIVEPMKDSQSIQIFKEEDVKKLFAAIARDANTKQIAEELIPMLVNKAKAIYLKLGEEEERLKQTVYKESIELLPNDDLQKRDIFWYFYSTAADYPTASKVFAKINDNSIKANILLKLIDKQDFDFISNNHETIENKHNLIPIVKSMIEFGHEDDMLTEKLIAYVAESQTALRYVGEYLVKNKKIDSKLFPIIVMHFKNRAELRKLGECVIDNDFVTHQMFDLIIGQFSGYNNAELRSLLFHLINSDKYSQIEIKEQIINVAKETEKEAEKIMVKLYVKDKAIVKELIEVNKIITTPEILARMEQLLKN